MVHLHSFWKIPRFRLVELSEDCEAPAFPLDGAPDEAVFIVGVQSPSSTTCQENVAHKPHKQRSIITNKESLTQK